MLTGIWKLSDDCIVNFDKSVIIKNGNETNVRNQILVFLSGLIESQMNKPDSVFKYNEIAAHLWSDEYITYNKDNKFDRHAFDERLDQIIKETRSITSKDLIICSRNKGYYLKNRAEKQNNSNLIEQMIDYYNSLWEHHIDGSYINNKFSSYNKKLIDYYVLPELMGERKLVDCLVPNGPFIKFIEGKPGFGKTSLLKIIILCNIYRDLLDSHTNIKSDITEIRIKKLDELRSAIQSDGAKKFPIFIDLSKVDDSVNNLINIADSHNNPEFDSLLNQAYSSGNLLFLIDSVDKTKSPQFISYSLLLDKLISDYPNAGFIITGTHYENNSITPSIELIRIEKLYDKLQMKITEALKSKYTAEKHATKYYINPVMFDLLKNPLILVIWLTYFDNSYEGFITPDLLEYITSNLLERRANELSYDRDISDIVLLLGHIAYEMIIHNRTSDNITSLDDYIGKAKDKLALECIFFDEDVSALITTCDILYIYNNNHDLSFRFNNMYIMYYLASYYLIHNTGVRKNELFEYINHLDVLTDDIISTLTLSVIMADASIKRFPLQILINRCITPSYDVDDLSFDSQYDESSLIKQAFKILLSGEYGNPNIGINKELEIATILSSKGSTTEQIIHTHRYYKTQYAKEKLESLQAMWHEINHYD